MEARRGRGRHVSRDVRPTSGKSGDSDEWPWCATAALEQRTTQPNLALFGPNFANFGKTWDKIGHYLVQVGSCVGKAGLTSAKSWANSANVGRKWTCVGYTWPIQAKFWPHTTMFCRNGALFVAMFVNLFEKHRGPLGSSGETFRRTIARHMLLT